MIFDRLPVWSMDSICMVFSKYLQSRMSSTFQWLEVQNHLNLNLCYLGICALSVICASQSYSRRQSSYFWKTMPQSSDLFVYQYRIVISFYINIPYEPFAFNTPVLVVFVSNTVSIITSLLCCKLYNTCSCWKDIESEIGAIGRRTRAKSARDLEDWQMFELNRVRYEAPVSLWMLSGTSVPLADISSTLCYRKTK